MLLPVPRGQWVHSFLPSTGLLWVDCVTYGAKRDPELTVVVLTRPPGCVQVQPDLLTNRSQPSSSKHGTISHHCFFRTMPAARDRKTESLEKVRTRQVRRNDRERGRQRCKDSNRVSGLRDERWRETDMGKDITHWGKWWKKGEVWQNMDGHIQEKIVKFRGLDGRRWDMQVDEEQWSKETSEQGMTVRDEGKMERTRQMERDGESCDQSGRGNKKTSQTIFSGFYSRSISARFQEMMELFFLAPCMSYHPQRKNMSYGVSNNLWHLMHFTYKTSP